MVLETLASVLPATASARSWIAAAIAIREVTTEDTVKSRYRSLGWTDIGQALKSPDIVATTDARSKTGTVALTFPR